MHCRTKNLNRIQQAGPLLKLNEEEKALGGSR